MISIRPKIVSLTLCVVGLMASPASWSTRQKHALEQFETAKLQVRSIAIRPGGNSFAYILDPNGYVHHVVVGEYIGNADGRVIEITASEVIFIELIKELDGYREVKTSLKCGTNCH